ncbi:hypothetical protein, partial [Paenibacillus antibioticophila]|uniref:hypothetical protein n=1 Tax=Paenibacillus antibioticophila TaxID=1274374 RepID=UPI001BB38F84
MKESDIDKIATMLSFDLADVYRETLRSRLNEHPDVLVDLGIIDENEPPPEWSIEAKLSIVSQELRAHSERFTVELIKRLFFDQNN